MRARYHAPGAARFALVLVLLAVFTAPPPVAAKVGDEWKELPPLPTPRQEVGVAAIGRSLWVIGGILASRDATGIVERYDADERTWHAAEPLPEGTGLHHVGAAAAGRRVYAVGGLDGSFRGVRDVFALDPATGEWSRRADLPWPRGALGVAALDGSIWVAGGQDGGTTFATAAVYDPAEDRWTELPGMPTARNHLAAAGHGRRFYAVGGRAGGLRGAFEALDIDTLEWHELAPLPTPRAGIAAAIAQEHLFVFGGEGNPARADGIFPQVESWDLEGEEWFERRPMPSPRHGIGAVTIDGAIHVPGGAPVEGFGTTDVHDVFFPGTPPGGGSVPFRRGDANRDRRIDISDPVTTLLFLFIDDDAELACEDAADADDSGRVDISDAIFTLNFLFLEGPPPPPPGPDAEGLDPTADELGCSEL